MKRYTATITCNLREVHTASPKILLINIKDSEGNIFRDHCWVKLNKRIETIRPKNGRNRPKKISFTAKTKQYIKSSLEYDHTLTSIANIVLL